MVQVWFALVSLATPKMLRMPPTSSRAQARRKRETMVAAAPPIIKGLLFPHLDLQLSLLSPTYGCTRVPESGPAIQTRASKDLLKPSEMRYGCRKVSFEVRGCGASLTEP